MHFLGTNADCSIVSASTLQSQNQRVSDIRTYLSLPPAGKSGKSVSRCLVFASPTSKDPTVLRLWPSARAASLTRLVWWRRLLAAAAAARLVPAGDLGAALLGRLAAAAALALAAVATLAAATTLSVTLVAAATALTRLVPRGDLGATLL
mmetsp:Transcript_17350/g.37296  ORF Transcript_17350/g.37296 Transcript_17350/m.37296 type:complete len:150 (-) Transcript_17350:1026-1475(-)